MRAQLAERLLAQVMHWDESKVAEYRPYLQSMASYKYDSYQQFAPGMRFVESLAVWLQQFEEPDLREAAFDFVVRRLVYFSNAEMNHFVAVAVRDQVLPVLLHTTAVELGVRPFELARIRNSDAFSRVVSRSLFLGLSDGARMDVFRRLARDFLTNEQVWQSYEVGPSKVDDFRKAAEERGMGADGPLFDRVFLLDDFTASGMTYLRKKADSYKGKIDKFFSGVASLDLMAEQVDVHLVVYVAAEAACEYLQGTVQEYLRCCGLHEIGFRVHVVQKLGGELALNSDVSLLGGAMAELIDRYSDPNAGDKHTAEGGDEVKYGFASCGLPVVLAHNTPNNSIFLLWADKRRHSARGLFPRVSRHQ